MLSSCGEDAVEPEEEYSTTPYNLIIPTNLPRAILPEDNPLTEEGVNLGKELFSDGLLSRDGSVSCNSCHQQGSAFSDKDAKFSLGVDGRIGTRNSMPLFNLFYHQKGFFWDGRADSLRHQALIPIEDPLEMDETLENVILKINSKEKYRNLFYAAFEDSVATEERLGLALEQFMFTLISGNSKYDKVQRGEEQFTESEKRGEELFFGEFDPTDETKGADCFHCHGSANFSNHDFMNNGLDKKSEDGGRFNVTEELNDRGAFKTPSLRNVAVTAPYMHDGRFETLEEVIEHYNSNVKTSLSLDANMFKIKNGIGLNQNEKQDLINFLKTLTDEEFISGNQ
jgi:cytochrome c peroxidase